MPDPSDYKPIANPNHALRKVVQVIESIGLEPPVYGSQILWHHSGNIAVICQPDQMGAYGLEHLYSTADSMNSTVDTTGVVTETYTFQILDHRVDFIVSRPDLPKKRVVVVDDE